VAGAGGGQGVVWIGMNMSDSSDKQYHSRRSILLHLWNSCKERVDAYDSPVRGRMQEALSLGALGSIVRSRNVAKQRTSLLNPSVESILSL